MAPIASRERSYKFAMPETAIGLFPDVGAAHALSRLPEGDRHVPGADGALDRARRTPTRWGSSPIAFRPSATRRSRRRSSIPGPSIRCSMSGTSTRARARSRLTRAHIARCFSAPTRGGDRRAARRTSPGPSATWAQGVIADLEARSPLSLKVTHRHIREAAARDLRQTLQSSTTGSPAASSRATISTKACAQP